MKLAIGLLFTAMLLPADAATVSIRADDWFPMNGDPSGKEQGYMIDMATAIFTAAGHTVDYKVMPWERAVKSVREGQFDCVVGAYPEDAPDFIFPTVSWGMDGTGYYVKNESAWQFTGFDSLLSQKVGVISGYAYGEEFDALIKSRPDVFKDVSGKDALEKNFKKLANNRIDVVVESVAVANAKLKALGFNSTLKIAGTNSEKAPIYIACSPVKSTSKMYIELVEKGTVTLRESGQLKVILDKYGLKDWQ
ncbi:substrate-binding periplasmic protein [Colwellia hornerae]|nr:transporter substrate-binding domain-containing protein [Colwellia hornerae]